MRFERVGTRGTHRHGHFSFAQYCISTSTNLQLYIDIGCGSVGFVLEMGSPRNSPPCMSDDFCYEQRGTNDGEGPGYLNPRFHAAHLRGRPTHHVGHACECEVRGPSTDEDEGGSHSRQAIMLYSKGRRATCSVTQTSSAMPLPTSTPDAVCSIWRSGDV
ncbi:hypothetical protein K458DRAFT_184584 [Lentithecium fluviatile CBS 122367]|uniref:Uncharacterized protein n=1 Tax=Lentithecium fluviatile CBS 122367 TaxID=1168545 RepID=A0A6G1J8Z4_9PLEO|nr:hypothetical protein K458DRAFT_184584 [Lentithecium fluviatile CBS 122367]